MNDFCNYLDTCGRFKINENCFRHYRGEKCYQENVCYEQRREEKRERKLKELKQKNLEKMILNLKKRIYNER